MMAAGVVAAVAAALPVVPAAAAPGDRPLPAGALGTLSPELAGVSLEGGPYRAAYDAWREASVQLRDAEGRRRSSEGSLLELQQVRDLTADRLAEAATARARAASERATAEDQLVDLAVGAFMGGTAGEPVSTPVLAGDLEDVERRAVLGEAAEEASVSDLDRTTAALDRAEQDEQAASAALADAERRFSEVSATRTAATGDARRWSRERERRRVALAALAPQALVAGTEMPAVALDAYWRGAHRVAAAGCGLSWAVLAGIGRVESGHGSAQGAEPGVDGVVRPRILGIALDGSRGTAVIPDSDGGALDGDVVSDRAVGPLQFIPSTWRTSGVDATRDGVADPNNLYDAAASAAGYLCRAAGGSPSPEAVGRAVFSYNHDQGYVRSVLGLARGYANVALPAAPPGPPVPAEPPPVVPVPPDLPEASPSPSGAPAAGTPLSPAGAG
jgi:membrane-bound lytic murein transglycosylase B